MLYRYGQKLQTRKMNIKKIITGAAASIALVTGAAVPALAGSIPTNFPGDTGTSCNAWHGAPGGLGASSPYTDPVQGEGGDGHTLPNNTVAPSSGANFGMEQGVNTGQNNSGFSAACNQ